MKNNRKLIILTLLFSIFLINPLLNNIVSKKKSEVNISNKITPKKSTYWTFTHIVIDNNWSDVAVKPWCSGDGTKNNPYLIENITIDAEGSGNALDILNSNDYFILNNLTIKNANPSSGFGININNADNGKVMNCHVYNNYYGIRISGGSSNNSVQNCNVSDNGAGAGGYGIVIRDLSDHNSIINNTVNSNENFGIYLYDGCDFNNISRNRVRNNKDIGIRLTQNCMNNTIFNNTISSNGNGEATDAGIYIQSTSNNNNISNNQVYNNLAYGLFLGASNLNIIQKNNYSKNDAYGITIQSDSDQNQINNNLIADNLDSGIYIVTNCDNNSISSNTIADNQDNSIEIVNNCNNNTIFNNTILRSNYNNVDIQNSHGNTVSFNSIKDSVLANTDGLYLSNADYTKIIKNNISNNYRHGINIGSNVDGGIITENIITDHDNLGSYGITIDSSANSQHIYKNAFIDNQQNAQGLDADTKWNNSYVGNYWSDHLDLDANRDGIGDGDYSIPGGAGCVDYLPIYGNPIHHGGKVHIDNNNVSGNGTWVWARTRFWCSGSGTYEDPYIIQGLEINAKGTGNCLTIANSTVYSAVKNCYLSNSGATSGNAGLILDSVNNTYIEKNNCSFNGYHGIYLRKSINNTIENNIMNFNNFHGLMLAVGCDNNSILNNIVKDNMNSGIYIADDNIRNRLINNTCSNEGTFNQNTGIDFGTSVKNSIITGNQLVKNVNYGIHFRSGSGYNEISHNFINMSGEYGIYFESSENNTLYNNTVLNSTQYAVYFDQSNNNSIQENYFLNSHEHGIYLFASHFNNFTKNIINKSGFGVFYGVLLDNSNNNLFKSNNISFSSNDGIRIEFCENNTFISNNILNNSGYGVNIEATSTKMLFYNNSFIGNVVHAQDNGTDNNWNNTIIGNYWDNYTGRDADDDNIGDTPHTFKGGTDYKPIWWDGKDLKHLYIDDSGFFGNGTWAWAITQEWCTGTGTWQDPYIISGLLFNASGVRSAIHIANSQNKYFIIKDCKLFNSGSNNYDAGIKLNNTNNGTLINNIIHSNNRNGIQLYNAKNNIIINNDLDLNTIAGIEFYFSHNNTLFRNNVSNSQLGIHLRFSSANNITLNSLFDNDIGIRLLETIYNNISKNTLIDNLEGGLVLVRSNFTLINNNDIKGSTTAFKAGIDITSAHNNSLNYNIIHGNYDGIRLDHCDNHTILQNIFTSNNNNSIYWLIGMFNRIQNNTFNNSIIYGAYLIGCHNNTISFNFMEQNRDGIFLSSSDSNQIFNNTLRDNDEDGISLLNSYFNKLWNNKVILNGFSGITLDNCHNNTIFWNNISYSKLSTGYGIDLVNSENNTIEENDVFSNGYGFRLYNSDYNKIKKNFIIKNNQDGIYLNDSINVTIWNNQISDNMERGIYLYHNSMNNTIFNNTITNNLTSNQEYGIYLLNNCNDNYILNNTIFNNDIDGIHLETSCRNNIISFNNISNIGSAQQANGIYMGGYCIDNNILQNTISNHSTAGIAITNCLRITISGNNLRNNSNNGIFLQNANYSNILENDVYYSAVNILTELCYFTNITRNNVSNATIYGSITSNKSVNITISGNIANFNLAYGICLVSSPNCTISKNIANFNNKSGVIVNSSHYAIISGNDLKFNNRNGLEINYSQYVRIINNAETINHNGYAGIILTESNNLIIEKNTIGYNEIGIKFIDSSHIFLRENTLIENGNDYVYVGNCIDIVFDTSRNGNQEEEDEQGKDDEKEPSTFDPRFIIIIIVVIGAVGCVGAISYMVIRKKTPDTTNKHKIAEPLKVASIAKKKVKSEEKLAKSMVLTEEEKQELVKTEEEVNVERQKFICIVHKGPIVGATYICPSCQAFYCQKCALAIKEKGEKCWSCDHDFEL